MTLDTADLAIESIRCGRSSTAPRRWPVTTLDRPNKLVVDLDKNFTVTAVQVDGVDAGFSNPEGRMTITLAKKAAKGAKLTVKIVYGGRPHTAVRAPWTAGSCGPRRRTASPGSPPPCRWEGCDLIWPCIDYPT